MQEAMFVLVSLVIAELWYLNFAKMRLCVDFRKLNCYLILLEELLLQSQPESPA